MQRNPQQASREERLAAKLRENLKRRKAHARAVDHRDREGVSAVTDDGALPKPPSKS